VWEVEVARRCDHTGNRQAVRQTGEVTEE
jgi:hypothetical protein